VSDPMTSAARLRAGSTDSRTSLRGRLLMQAGSADVLRLAARVPLNGMSGLVVTGAQNFGLIAQLRRSYPELLLATEPDVDKDSHAEPSMPFVLGEPNLFGTPTLNSVLDDQLEAGASFALTPTGHIRAADALSMKAAVEQANALDRDDVVLRLPCDAYWVKPAHITQLQAVVSRSRHPVALSLTHRTDPMLGKGVVAGVQALSAAIPDLALWRTDLAAVEHLVNGGLAGAVGLLPSLRHGLAPGQRGFAIDKSDRTPKVLIPGWLHYMRGSHLQRVFASSAPPHCDCQLCGGAPLDRFTGSDEDRALAHDHNATVITKMAEDLDAVGAQGRDRWWGEQLQTAVDLHDSASRSTGSHVGVPDVVLAWAKQRGIAC